MRVMLWTTATLCVLLTFTLLAELRRPLGAQEVVLEIKPYAPPLPSRKPHDEPVWECIPILR